MGDINIRRVKSEEGILNVLVQCADSIYDQSYNNDKLLADLSRKYSQKAFFYLIEIGNKPSGYIAFYGNDMVNKAGFVSMIVVRQGYQGFGVGNILMDTAISICKLQGMTSIQLEVNNENGNAMRFYERKGFVIKEQKASSNILSKIFI